MGIRRIKMKYNANDGVWYCTAAEYALISVTDYPDTSKVYLVDTKASYIFYSGTAYAL